VGKGSRALIGSIAALILTAQQRPTPEQVLLRATLEVVARTNKTGWFHLELRKARSTAYAPGTSGRPERRPGLSGNSSTRLAMHFEAVSKRNVTAFLRNQASKIKTGSVRPGGRPQRSDGGREPD
jgi:hypothetical protein